MTMLKKFLDHQDKKTSDVMYMQVVERLSTGQYRCRRITDNREVIASKANPADEFTENTWVVVTYLGASRTAIGGSYVVISRAPQEQKGITGGPLTSVEGLETPTVSGWSPNPLVLEQNGPSGAIVIYGTGFLDPPLPYDEGLSDAAGPLVSPTTITLEIEASDLAALGPHSIEVYTGVSAKDSVKVVPSSAPPTDFIWVTGFEYNDTDFLQHNVLVQISKTDLELVAFYQFPAVNFAAVASGMVQVGQVLWWVGDDSSDEPAQMIGAVDIATNAFDSWQVLPRVSVDMCQLSYDQDLGKLLLAVPFNEADPKGAYQVTTADPPVPTVLYDTTPDNGAISVVPFDDYIIMAGFFGVRQFPKLGVVGAEYDNTEVGQTERILVPKDADGLTIGTAYVTAQFFNKIYEIPLLANGVTGWHEVLGTTFVRIHQVADKAYVLDTSNGNIYWWTCDAGGFPDFALLVTLPAHTYYDFWTDGEFFYVLTTGNRVVKVNLDGSDPVVSPMFWNLATPYRAGGTAFFPAQIYVSE